jgi:ribosome biogenesis GTPase
MMREGVLLKAFGGFYFVQDIRDSEQKIYTCSLRGRLKQDLKDVPLGLIVGDRVAFAEISTQSEQSELSEKSGQANEGVIEELLPRSSFLIRPKIANVEQCLIVLAAQHPQPDYLLLDRLLVSLFAAGIQPLLCFNKVDLPGAEEIFQEQLAIYSQADIPVFAVSALHEQGIEQVKQALHGKITTVAGQSGVGKSTLLNLVQEGQVLQTGGISRKLQRGRHTTRTVELLPLACGGWIADTPGFSRLDFPDEITVDNLAGYYPDFVKLAGECRFDVCRHEKEPDCRVKAAVEAGELSYERYRRYLLLLESLRNKNTNY